MEMDDVEFALHARHFSQHRVRVVLVTISRSLHEQVAQVHLHDRLQTSACRAIGRGKKRHIMTALDQFIREQLEQQLDSSVGTRWDWRPKRCHLSDSQFHVPALEQTRIQIVNSTREMVRPLKRFNASTLQRTLIGAKFCYYARPMSRLIALTLFCLTAVATAEEAARPGLVNEREMMTQLQIFLDQQ